MLFIELLLIGISLSIDAFSLAVSLGINNKINKDIKLYSLLVGVLSLFSSDNQPIIHQRRIKSASLLLDKISSEYFESCVSSILFTAIINCLIPIVKAIIK